MFKIKKGDTVIVKIGKDKDRQAKVLRIFPKERTALVENIRLCKKHVKPNPQAGVTGGIVSREMPIPLSNLALYNPKIQKADKIFIKALEDGKRARYFKSTNEQVDFV
jgi:large subunit ribosomal protein L24